MKEYITKDRAKQFVCGHCNEVCSEEPCEPSDCDWMAFIDKEPAADVVEVRYGRVMVHDGYEDEYYECCSECKTTDIHLGDNFCPNCGCKLVGVKHSKNKE